MSARKKYPHSMRLRTCYSYKGENMHMSLVTGEGSPKGTERSSMLAKEAKLICHKK